MTLKISLAQLGSPARGFIAILENEDGTTIDITPDPSEVGDEEACREAAQLLREAAARFDLLATRQDRCKEVTHAAVNRAKV